MTAAPRCSVVIRAFNEEEHVGRLLSGILEQTLRPTEILLVDSGSTDATLSIASRFPVQVLWVRPEEHFRLLDFARLCASNVVSDLWHAGHEHRLPAVASEILWFRWMQFWGTYRGFRRAGPLTGALKQTFYYPRGLGRREAARREVAPIDYGRGRRRQ
jgi:glycosyltransferase involved in cell wall biosynthesis